MFDVRLRVAPAGDVPSYRDISRNDQDDDDEEMDVIDSVLSRFSTLEEDVRRRTSETERYLHEHPDDIQTWISYSTLHLKLSPEAERPGSGLQDPATLPQTRANAEVTLSILDHALNAHKDNMSSTKLHIAYVRAAEAFWPAEKVTGRWRNVIRELDQRGAGEAMMEVWLCFIEWKEGQGFGKGENGGDAVGGVDDVMETYAECLANLLRGKHPGA